MMLTVIPNTEGESTQLPPSVEILLAIGNALHRIDSFREESIYTSVLLTEFLQMLLDNHPELEPDYQMFRDHLKVL